MAFITIKSNQLSAFLRRYNMMKVLLKTFTLTMSLVTIPIFINK